MNTQAANGMQTDARRRPRTCAQMAITKTLPEAEAHLRYEVIDLYVHALQRQNEASLATNFLRSTLAEATRCLPCVCVRARCSEGPLRLTPTAQLARGRVVRRPWLCSRSHGPWIYHFSLRLVAVLTATVPPAPPEDWAAALDSALAHAAAGGDTNAKVPAAPRFVTPATDRGRSDALARSRACAASRSGTLVPRRGC